jgi:hypothetical protein
MQEDLAILETVFASRNAIKDLHNLDRKSHEHSTSTSSTSATDITPSFKPGAHGRNLSSATGVDTPVMEDVLPMSEKKKEQEELARRFSLRGIRLAVHSSIIDTNAHEVPISLRKKWLHQAHLRRESERIDIGSPSIAQLSRISEVNSNAGADELPSASIRQLVVTTPDGELVDENMSTERANSQESSIPDRLRERSSSLRTSPLGQQLGHLITRLSRASLHERRTNHRDSPRAVEQDIYPPSEINDHVGMRRGEQVPLAKETPAKEKQGWSYRLTRPFVKEEPTTPDFERGF